MYPPKIKFRCEMAVEVQFSKKPLSPQQYLSLYFLTSVKQLFVTMCIYELYEFTCFMDFDVTISIENNFSFY